LSCNSIGKPLSEVFVIINGVNREPEPNPYERVLSERKTVALGKIPCWFQKTYFKVCFGKHRSDKSSDREIMGVVVVFRDITRIRKAEEKLQKLSQAVEQSPVSL